jgi:hypothetical protein
MNNAIFSFCADMVFLAMNVVSRDQAGSTAMNDAGGL